jgi:hypothetical protein
MICAYCGTELPASALFCGECGRSLALANGRPRVPAMAASAPAEPPVVVEQPEEVEQPVVVEVPAVVEQPAVVEPVETAPPAVVETPAVVAPVVEPVETPPTPAPQPNDTVEISAWDVPLLEPAAQWSPPSRLLRPDVDPVEDLEATRIVGQSLGGKRFVLQFSTGESVTIFGTGLVGRNPAAEPGEYFDQLVSIVDPGKSVSKTHLEFGQAAGKFWISDRYSGNGTVVREPDSTPKRCDPGKRYRIVRGTRVSIGEQFFVVS